MTEEVREELAPVEAQETVTQESDNAAFEAGFAIGSGDEVEAPVAVEEPIQEEAVEPENVTPPPPTTEQLIEQAKAEIYRELAKVRDTSAGRIGEVNQRMQQLLSQQQSAGGSGVKLTKESLKRLNSEFGEMAEMLAEDLSEALGNFGGGAPAFDPSVIDQQVTQRVAAVKDELSKDMERYKLSLAHDDWEEVVGREDFRSWLGGQPLEYQDRINNSWNAREIATALSSFKEQTQKVQQQAQQRQERLANAVTPTQATQAAPAPDASDDFLAGWNSVRGKP